LPIEGVHFTRGENGEQIPISPMINTTDENGESVWIRPSDNMGNGDTVSKNWGRTAMTGIAALGAMAAPAVETYANAHEYSLANDISAIVQEVPAPQTSDDILEQFQSDGWTITDGTKEMEEESQSRLQAVGELAGNIRELSEAWYDGVKQREEDELISEEGDE
jgi:hypothetical protein